MKKCDYCPYEVPPSESRCPHCGRPSYFPNVDKALEEQHELQTRYDSALTDAATRGVSAIVADFENELNSSKAVINRPCFELNLLTVENKVNVYQTYYHLSEGIRLQKGNDEFDSLRRAADGIFFTLYEKEIRFAVLSLDSNGLENYGECSWVLKEEMIEHRASLFDDNTTLYYLNNSGLRGASDVPAGHRAIWKDRAKLCVAKLVGKICDTTSAIDFPALLLVQGATSKDDKIVEIHIFGPMTVNTIEEVVFKPIDTTISKKDQKTALGELEGVKNKLHAQNVKYRP